MNPSQDVITARRGNPEPTAAGLQARYRFAPDLPVFAGHFPGRPLVPGVYLLAAMADLLQRSEQADAAAPVEVTGLRRVKFRAAVPPDQDILVTLRWPPTSERVQATAHCDAQLAAQAQLVVA